jgi:hypothetical protein
MSKNNTSDEDRAKRFQWNDGDVTITSPGKDTPEKKEDRSDRFSWNDGDVTITSPGKDTPEKKK